MASYKLGLPSTNKRKLKKIQEACKNRLKVPDGYNIPDEANWPESGRTIFETFFASNTDLFGSTDGAKFYNAIRNGLLHQGQTKDGWRIKRVGRLWDEKDKILNRDLFAQKLEEYFNAYLASLKSDEWDKENWSMARRKIWWLATLSEGTLKELSE